jgi:hypothetical protein
LWLGEREIVARGFDRRFRILVVDEDAARFFPEMAVAGWSSTRTSLSLA